MDTNMTISKSAELYLLGNRLITAGYEFWQEHQKVCGPSAVVWLTLGNGMFICFTRGEHKEALLRTINIECEGERVFTEEDWFDSEEGEK